MERRFIKSGIPGLDNVLGGGIIEGSVIAVTGPTGVGKSTLAAQFLYSGAVESNEPGLYICLEESRRDFFFHNSGYTWDFLTLEKEHKFILLDYPIHEVDQIINQSSAIAEIINNTGTKRVVIDSIMPIALYFKGDDERKRGFLKLIDSLHKWNVTTLIVSEDLKMAHSGARPASEFGIESFTDGWINMFYKYDDKTMDRSRFLEIVKMKGIAHSHRAFPALLGNEGFSMTHELAGGMPAKKAKMPPPRQEKPQEETMVSIEPGELTLPHPMMEEPETRPEPKPSAPRQESRPPPVPEPPIRPLSSKRKLVKDDEMEQLKKLLEEEAPAQKKAPKPAPKSGSEGPPKPAPKSGSEGKPPAPPPKQAPAKPPPAREAPAKAAPEKPAAPTARPAPAAKPAPRPLPTGRPAPAKMSPSIQARLDEVKKKIMKKK